MPPFPPRVSALLGSLNRKHGDTGDKRTWVHGGKEANMDREVTKRRATALDPSDTDNSSATANQDIMSSLAGLDISSSSSTPLSSATLSDSATPFDKVPRLLTSPSVDRWFEKLTYTSEGVLFEDSQIQVGIKSRYQSHIGQLAIYLGNKVDAPLTSFTTALHVNDTSALSVSFTKIPPSTIGPRSQTQQLLQVECKKMFMIPPILTISYLAGSHQTISIRLPIVLTKFFEHVKLGQSDFFERWKLIGGEREAQQVFPVTLTSAGQLDLPKHRQVVSGHRLNLLDDIDPNPNNLVGAGVLHMSVEGKVGCLLRLEPNREAKVSSLLDSSPSWSNP